jgi:hypothetical protein
MESSAEAKTMTQMLFQSIPGAVDLPGANIAAHQLVTDDTMVKIAQNAKFGCVRPEFIFMGFYKNGDTIPAPISPVDQYGYQYSELIFDTELYTTRGPNNDFVSGQASNPSQAISQPANLYWHRYDVDDTTGKVSIDVSYFKPGGSETLTHDGIVRVIAICQRQSVNVAS